MKHSTNLLT